MSFCDIVDFKCTNNIEISSDNWIGDVGTNPFYTMFSKNSSANSFFDFYTEKLETRSRICRFKKFFDTPDTPTNVINSKIRTRATQRQCG